MVDGAGSAGTGASRGVGIGSDESKHLARAMRAMRVIMKKKNLSNIEQLFNSAAFISKINVLLKKIAKKVVYFSVWTLTLEEN